MRVYKQHGTKERLFEMMKNVSKSILKEDFDYHDAEMDHLGQQDLAADQAANPEQSPVMDHPVDQQQTPIKEQDQQQFELNLATDMYKHLIDARAYTPKNDLDRLAIDRMMKDGLLDYDSEEGEDYYWLNNKGMIEIKSPQDIINDYMYSMGGGNDSEAPYLRGYEP